MSEFFGRLETELRAAAERKPRRTMPAPALLAVALLAVALAPIVIVLGSGTDDGAPPDRRATDDAPPADGVLAPVGSTMPEKAGRGLEARSADTTVVATGVAPVSGPWQLETFRDPSGECLGLYLVEADPETDMWFSAICPLPSGGAPLPGFNAQAMGLPTTREPDEYLVYGRTPEDAAAVRLTREGEVVERVDTSEGPDGVPGDFYVMYLPPDLEIDGRMEWLDQSGEPGDEGVRFRLP
jgi:hypothetical protein